MKGGGCSRFFEGLRDLQGNAGYLEGISGLVEEIRRWIVCLRKFSEKFFGCFLFRF